MIQIHAWADLELPLLIEHSVKNSGDPYQTPRSVASDLGLHRLHTSGSALSHKKDARQCIFNFYSNFNRTFCKQTIETERGV